ncbi:hypothetical protein ACQE3E_08035 [Methylomonas sp. MED-D]|uniref:hypothetical protein n=1 Tax=Methylomonas sp. MED-D TaxID=3418768 RepID=UPI003D021ED3
MSDQHDNNFSGQRTAIPFGKFDTGVEDVFPCNESMIGREGARTKLIDFLTNAGTRKAILVTGRRGMGKSSFVKYCLDEYEKARIERYWRSDFGRTIFALIWLLFISMLGAITFVVASDLIQVLLYNAIDKWNNFMWIPLLILSACVIYLIFHASKILTLVFQRFRMAPSIFALVALISFLVVFVYLPDGGSPVLTMSRLIVAVSAVYLLGEWLDLIDKRIQKSSWFEKLKTIIIFGRIYEGIIPISLFGAGVVFAAFTYQLEAIVFFVHDHEAINIDWLSNILVSTELLGIALVNKCIGLIKLPKHLNELQISHSLDKSKWWFFGLGLLLLYVPIITILADELVFGSFSYNTSSGWVFLVGEILLITFLRCLFQPHATKEQVTNVLKYKRDCFRPRVYPSALFSLKAILLLIISMNTLHPIVARFDVRGQDRCNHKSISNIKSWSLCVLNDRPYTNGLFKESDDKKANAGGGGYFPLLPKIKEKLVYITLIVMLVSLIFLMEYEWIIRPDQFCRSDKTLAPRRNRPGYYHNSEQPSYEMYKTQNAEKTDKRKTARQEIQQYLQHQATNREHYRKYEELTFLGYFNSFHLSTLISTINLGFEELDHCRVIHAMAQDVRHQYFEKFVSMRSPCVLMRSAFGLIAAMVLVTVLATDRFNTDAEIVTTKIECSATDQECTDDPQFSVTMPTINSAKLDGEKTIIGQFEGHKIIINKPVNDILKDKYCQRDEGHIYEYLPIIPKLLCELGGFYSETLLPFIYFELLPIELPSNFQSKSSTELLRWVFDVRIPYYYQRKCNVKNNCDKSFVMSFCAYHLILFVFIFYLYRRINWNLELIPYSINLDRIDALLSA